MNEKIYKAITNAGIVNLIIGVITIVSGITMGVLLLVSGARLLKSKSKVMF